MKFAKSPIVLVALGLLGAFLLGSRIAESQAVTAPARIGFVDVAVIFQKYSKASDIQMKVRADLQILEADLRKQFDELKKKRADLDLLVPGTPDYTSKKRDLDMDAFRLEYAEKESKQAIISAAVKKMNLVYTEISLEAENYARRTGLNAVFMYNKQTIEARSPEEVQVMIASRPVIYRDKTMDITDAVLAILQPE
jgi:Skp family chaperone for outer membrane proteins